MKIYSIDFTINFRELTEHEQVLFNEGHLNRELFEKAANFLIENLHDIQDDLELSLVADFMEIEDPGDMPNVFYHYEVE